MSLYATLNHLQKKMGGRAIFFVLYYCQISAEIHKSEAYVMFEGLFQETDQYWSWKWMWVSQLMLHIY